MTTSTSRSIGVVLHDLSLGGTERIALRLAREWARQGASVTLFCGQAAGPLRSLAGDRVRVIEAQPPVPRGAGSRARLGATIARMLSANPVDLVFVPGNYHWPVVRHVAAMGNANARPRIVAQVSAALRKPQRGVVRQWAFDRRMRHLLHGADAIVVMTDEAARQARAVLRDTVVQTIPTPALDDPRPVPVPPPPGPPTILGVGRLVSEKGFDTLIAAFARCGVGEARLVIAGSGPDEARLRALAQRLGVADRVVLPGYVADSRPWLDRARLFVLSSRFEGYPAVLVEALAAGRPVVATDCTAATRLLDLALGAGATVPVGDVDAMARAIGTLLAAPAPDPHQLATLVSGHDITRVARSYSMLFAELTG